MFENEEFNWILLTFYFSKLSSLNQFTTGADSSLYFVLKALLVGIILQACVNVRGWIMLWMGFMVFKGCGRNWQFVSYQAHDSDLIDWVSRFGKKFKLSANWKVTFRTD